MDSLIKVNLMDENVGYPTPGIDTTKFTLVFDKLPMFRLLCNKVQLPDISLGVAEQNSPLLSYRHVGEKLIYGNFTAEFVHDQNLLAYQEIHEWMKRLSVQGLNSDTISNAKLLTIGGEFDFVNVFPISLSGIIFDATQTTISFPVCQVTFACDYYTIVKEK